MKGSNKLLLNEATVREALEYWLTNKVLKTEGITVTGFRSNSSNSYANEYEVTLNAPVET